MENANKERQNHFLTCLLEGRKDIKEDEAAKRIELLGLNDLMLPCIVACVAPDLTPFSLEEKDGIIFRLPRFIVRFFSQKGITCYALLNAYDNVQVLLSRPRGKETDNMFVELHEKLLSDFGCQQFIGIGSEVNEYCQISVSSSEAFGMLGYKYQYADRGVINISNIIHFRHNLSYAGDEAIQRVIGCFQDGDLAKMSVRLGELIEGIRNRPGVSGTSIKRTMIELTVHILHIAANANVDVDKALNGRDPYNWIMEQQETPAITEWFMNLTSTLLGEIQKNQESQKKKIIQTVCDQIDENLGDPQLGLQLLSDNVGLSPSYLSQMFKSEKGLGINNYITKMRIERAKELLRKTEYPIEDIARQLGFARSNYFGMVFKKTTGDTPGAYRRNGREPVTK